jgi:ribosomal protein S15P/S13E
MTLGTEEKQEIIAKFGGHDNDSGSAAVQVAQLTQRIRCRCRDHRTSR